MRVLSIQQPWVYAMLNLGKRIENRSWGTDYRGPIALHATKPVNRYELYFDLGTCYRCCDGKLYNGSSEDPGYVPFINELSLKLVPKISKYQPSILAVADLVDVVTVSDSKWFFGGFGLVLDNVRELPNPIPCKGKLGLWTPDAALLDQILNAFPEGNDDWDKATTICDNCSKVIPFNDQQACRSCQCVLCNQCVEDNTEATCDECLDVEESEVE